ncbi:hypothetical protein COY27_03245 [Candidatus Woesearchaeota archaeon CG_4_10_14_0_2_um_filter_33_13]|nr:MAG: hypothetical protein COY27_03245 [Candidatus Woesearchaeota archaeon CG_4_10_14_0_2_um_filter_33_13]
MMREILLGWFGEIPNHEIVFNKYLLALGILILTALMGKLVLFIFEKVLEKLAKKTKSEIDDILFDKTKKPIFYLVLASGLRFAVLDLQLGGWISKLANSLMALVFVFIMGRSISVGIEVWGHSFAKKTKSNFDDVMLPLFHKTVNVIFIFVALVWVLRIWEIDVTPYLAGAGIAGVVLGFALQDSLKNIFGGVTLLLDRTYQIGDKVKLESGEVGTILDIGLRSTKLRTYDNELVYIPNGYLANSRVMNYTRPSPRVRVGVAFGVEYGSDVTKVKDVVKRTILKIEGCLIDPAPSIQFLEMANFSLNFKAYFWVDRWDIAFDKKLEATEAIYNALNKAKINIPFPTQTIYIKK